MAAGLIHVAFSGHSRPQDLGDPAEAVAGLEAAFSMIAAIGKAALLTGLADGADSLAVRAWSAMDLGPVHAVHPFLDFRPDPAVERLVGSATWLDGASLESGRRNPYLAQARGRSEAADRLVVVWSGARGRGAGGTADAVQVALHHNVPVLWVRPGRPSEIRLIRPEHLESDFGFLEFLEQLRGEAAPLVVPATAEELARALARLAPLEEADPGAPPPPQARGLDRWLRGSLWKSYAAFTRMVGGRVASTQPPPVPPDDLRAQAGFRVLTETYEAADAEASRLAAIHRSQQILLLIAAIGAAAVGSSPAVWPEFKIYAVLIELGLALSALAISFGGTRVGRHERWGEARRLAEQLRIERASWALGLSTLPRMPSEGPVRGAVRRVCRRAGLAEGPYDADRVRRWGSWAMGELIGGQAEYHRVHGHLNERIAHRIHRFETLSFSVFLLALTGFAIAYVADEITGLRLPSWLAGAVVMTGVIVPAVAAASIALEATLAFGEQGRRDLALAGRLAAVGATLGDAPRLDQLQRAAKAAIALEVSQEERWSDESFRRRLVRAG